MEVTSNDFKSWFNNSEFFEQGRECWPSTTDFCYSATLLLTLLDICDLVTKSISVWKIMFLHSYENETVDV